MGFVGYLLLTPAEVSERSPAVGQDSRDVEKSTGKVLETVRKGKPSRREKSQRDAQAADESSSMSESGSGLSPADEKRIDEIQAAMDEGEFSQIERLTSAAVNHPKAAVRQKAVEALMGFGEKALTELTPYLADADENVRSEAGNEVELVLSTMENDEMKVDYIESLMNISGVCTEDNLAMFSGILKGVSDETLTARAAVRVIEDGKDPVAAKTMKEVYEFATGEAYQSPEQAENWIQQNILEKKADAADAAGESL